MCDNKTVENNKIAVDTGRVTIVDCFLDANPPASKVYWISSKQGHQSKISSSQYTLMDGFSRLSYQPDRCVTVKVQCSVPILCRYIYIKLMLLQYHDSHSYQFGQM